MGENSKIEWTDHTFNPWIGCAKVAEGCRNCYAERDFKQKPQYADCWGPGARRAGTSGEYWRKPLTWNANAAKLGTRYRVFCGSLCDVFEERLDLFETKLALMGLIATTQNLDWLLLTKRMGEAERFFENVKQDGIRHLGNLWLGCSISNQEDAERLIPILLRIQVAGVRFVSVEPMLGPVDLRGKLGHWTHPDGTGNWFSPVPGTVFRRDLDWVICGGESGPNARSMHPDWPRGLRDQCQAAGTPFFFKQWGEWAPSIAVSELMAERMEAEYNERFDVWRVGKKAAGRLLDGREWNEMPESEGAK